MSEENVEVVRRIYAEWGRGNMRGGVELFDPEIVFESYMPDAKERIVANGVEEVAAFMREFLAQWRDYRLIGDEFRQVGTDKVLVVGRQTALGRQSGAAVEGPTNSVWTFRDDKVVHLLFETDRQKALEASGLNETARSPATIELAHQVMEALSQQDLSRLIALADPEVEWHSFFAQLGEGGVYRGHDGTREYMRDLGDAWEIVRADVDEAIAVGDVAVLVGRIHYRGKGSGIETETAAGWMLKFRDAKVTCFRAFREPELGLQRVGLSE